MLHSPLPAVPTLRLERCSSEWRSHEFTCDSPGALGQAQWLGRPAGGWTVARDHSSRCSRAAPAGSIAVGSGGRRRRHQRPSPPPMAAAPRLPCSSRPGSSCRGRGSSRAAGGTSSSASLQPAGQALRAVQGVFGGCRGGVGCTRGLRFNCHPNRIPVVLLLAAAPAEQGERQRRGGGRALFSAVHQGRGRAAGKAD